MAITISTEPRYRYYEEAPERITVPASELLEQVPVEFHQSEAGGNLSGRKLDLSCRDLFGGNTPRLSLGALLELLPDLIQLPEGADRWQRIPLPAGWLALHFRLITRREELPQEPVATEELPVAAEAVAERPSEGNTAKDAPASTAAVHEDISREPVAVAGEDLTAEQASPAGSVKVAEVAPGTVEKKRGFFASLPIFRRHHPVKKSTGDLLTRELAPVPLGYSFQKENESRSNKPSELLDPFKSPKQAGPPESASLQGSQESPLKLERLWKLDPHDILADPASLQSLFMTEEKLSLDRVMAMAGQLPGLRACVLAHGDQVICASSTPAGMDLRNLSTQAMTMLTQIRESSAKMGLGAVPAVTLHAEQGVLSFLHQGELCLLVLHADRGFVPGVRERLQEMLGHLSAAKALPSGPSAQASLPI